LPRLENTPWQGVIVGALVGTAFGLTGFAIALIPGPVGGMGAVMFILVPFAAGAAIALVTPGRAMAAAAILSAFSSLFFLVAAGKEGLLCAALAFPLIFVALCVGLAVGYIITRFANAIRGRGFAINSIVLIMMPLMIYTGHRWELRSLTGARREIVTTSIHLPALPEQVWANIQSLPVVHGEKPLLMYVGLPIPQRCVLEGVGVGAKRTCYFDHGYIEEIILAWDPPRSMVLSINRTNMPGRHWLEFEGADYRLRPDGDGTALTRTTMIASHLYPVWYWRRFERLGVEDEHEYLFSDLARRFPFQQSLQH
jgi:hypothetical protein